jgi:hypothetical protein
MACKMVALHDFTTWFVLYATSRLLNVDYKIYGILGVPVLIDAAAVGSRAYRPRFW